MKYESTFNKTEMNDKWSVNFLHDRPFGIWQSPAGILFKDWKLEE